MAVEGGLVAAEAVAVVRGALPLLPLPQGAAAAAAAVVQAALAHSGQRVLPAVGLLDLKFSDQMQ